MLKGGIMSVRLYKDGGSVIVRGVACDEEYFDAEHAVRALKGGIWRRTPEKIVEEPEEIEDDFKTSLEAMENDEVRAFAESEGIEGHDSSRISTLIRKLVEKAEDE
jgi:hypothetical protein